IDAFDNKIAKISGGGIPSKVEAGEIIRKGFDDGVDNFFQNITNTYDTLQKELPAVQMLPKPMAMIESKLSGIEKWARGRAERGFKDLHRAQANEVLRSIEAV